MNYKILHNLVHNFSKILGVKKSTGAKILAQLLIDTQFNKLSEKKQLQVIENLNNTFADLYLRYNSIRELTRKFNELATKENVMIHFQDKIKNLIIIL